MKITGVDAFALRAPSATSEAYWGSRAWAQGSPPPAWEEYPPRWRMRAAYSDTINTVIVRITTDAGLTGYGEAKAPVAPVATREIVRDLLAPVVLGADPLDIDVLWERMYSTMRLRAHGSGFLLEALSGVDLALWDLAGKALGVQACKLLGGAYRTGIKVYASGLPGLKDRRDAQARQRLQDQARAVVARGFCAIKLAIGFGVQTDIATVATVREAVGESIWLLCDAAGNYDVD
ncbi:MAG: mandelate racemase/muconate lactonizing enzyme family protein, partial [Firmicutes bacterium]|nr:mandelate racemase/muconate lactonizing enzyme family protein [Bacillota bacterium]